MGVPMRAGGAYVELNPRLTPGFDKEVEKQLAGPLNAIAQRTSSIGKTLSKNLTVPLIGGVVVLGAAALKLDDALDTVALRSGATGETLAGLEDSFRNVAARVPNDMGQVAEAIGLIHARTNATGPALESLARQTLTLSRITGDDLNEVLKNSTRLFGDWGVQAENQGSKLDFLYRLTQTTGTSFTELSGRLVQFGAPLRQLGFSFEQSAAMLAKFEREGVNTELVMGALRVALGRMTQGSEEARQHLEEMGDAVASARDRVGGLTDRVADARASLHDAFEQAGETVKNYQRQLEDARRALEDALTPPSEDELTGAQLRIERSLLAQEKAADDAAKAEQELEEARAEGDPAAIAEAERRLREARLGQKEAALGAREAEERLAELRRQGTDADERVIDARERLADTTRQLQKAEQDSAEQIAKAQDAVISVSRDLAKANTEAAAAQRDLAAAQQLASGTAADLPQRFRAYITEIKNARTQAEATGLAIEVFGARAGPDMAAAIREGRLEIDGLLGGLGDTAGSIQGAADRTDGFSEMLAKFRDRVIRAAEPLATRLLTAAEGIMPPLESLLGLAAGLVDSFMGLTPGLQQAVSAFVAFLAVIGPTLFVGSKLVSTMGSLASTLGATFNAGRSVVTGIGRLAGGFADANVAGSAFSGRLGSLGGMARRVADGFVALAQTVARTVAQMVVAFAQMVARAAVALAQTVVALAVQIAQWVALGAAALASAAQIALAWLIAVGPIALVVAAVVGLVALVVANWERITEATQTAFGFIRDVVGGVAEWLGNLFMNWTLPGLIIRHFDDIVGAVGRAVSWIKEKVGGLAAGLVQVFLDWTLPGLIFQHFDDIVAFVRSLPGRIADAARGMWDGITHAFKSAINALLFIYKAFRDFWNSVEVTVGGYDLPGPLPSVPEVVFGLPDLPDLPYLDKGGRVLSAGLAVVHKDELLNLPRGAEVEPLDRVRNRLAGDVAPAVIFQNFGTIVSEQELEDLIYRLLIDRRRKNATLGLD